jgi:hypothetical protein
VRELLRPPAHRGPLIAAGAVLVTLALVLVETRFSDEWSEGVHLLVLAPVAALVFGLGMQARTEGGRPPAYQSVLLVSGLVLSLMTLFSAVDVLGADDTISASTLVWVLLAFGTLALWPGIWRTSAICAFVAALAYGGALLAAVQWIFDPDGNGTFRWLLFLLAWVYGLASLLVRNSYPRHSEQLVNAAGLSILAIGAMAGVLFFLPFSGESGFGLPGFWELVLLVAGVSLLAVAAADRSPGPAYLGVANLALFAVFTGGEDATLEWWPAILLVLGGLAMAAGLRPRSPLPPEPAPYSTRDTPLSARTAGEVETVIRVRDES